MKHPEILHQKFIIWSSWGNSTNDIVFPWYLYIILSMHVSSLGEICLLCIESKGNDHEWRVQAWMKANFAFFVELHLDSKVHGESTLYFAKCPFHNSLANMDGKYISNWSWRTGDWRMSHCLPCNFKPMCCQAHALAVKLIPKCTWGLEQSNSQLIVEIILKKYTDFGFGARGEISCELVPRQPWVGMVGSGIHLNWVNQFSVTLWQCEGLSRQNVPIPSPCWEWCDIYWP